MSRVWPVFKRSKSWDRISPVEARVLCPYYGPRTRWGGEMCGEEQPSEEFFWIFRSQGKLVRKNSKIFLAGTSLVSPKCTNSSQNVQIPCHGEKNVNLIPRRELLAKISTLGILAGPRHPPTYPAKQCLREKTPWLIPYWSWALTFDH